VLGGIRIDIAAVSQTHTFPLDVAYPPLGMCTQTIAMSQFQPWMTLVMEGLLIALDSAKFGKNGNSTQFKSKADPPSTAALG
jgi:hypothetical protein